MTTAALVTWLLRALFNAFHDQTNFAALSLIAAVDMTGYAAWCLASSPAERMAILRIAVAVLCTCATIASLLWLIHLIDAVVHGDSREEDCNHDGLEEMLDNVVNAVDGDDSRSQYVYLSHIK